MDEFTGEVETALNILGHAIFCVQQLEMVLVHNLVAAIPGKDALKRSKVKQTSDNLRENSSLGNLVAMLKERADIDDDTLEIVNRVVKNRNTLSHKLLYIVPDAGDSIVASIEISKQLISDCDILVRLFTDLMISKGLENGIASSVDNDLRDFVGRDKFGSASNLVRPRHSLRLKDK